MVSRAKSFTIILFILLILLRAAPAASETGILSVTATVLSKSNCKFNSKTAALNFGNLDPAAPVDRTVSVSISFVCHGSANPATFSITDDDGMYETGPNASRMRHTMATTEYLPYSLTLNPASGTVPKGVDQTLTITGTVMGSDYQDAYAGSYSDSVVISIEP